MTDVRHVETQVVPGRRLGRRAPDPSKQRLRLELTGATPAHPESVDHLGKIANWEMFANDRFGTCGPAAVAHYYEMVSTYLTGTTIRPSLNDVYALYTLCNPTFNPNTGVGDNGVDMGEMLGFVCSNGIGGKKALAHATVQVNSIDDVRAVVSIFGGALLGVTLETAQQNQTNVGLWDYSPSPIWGGHAVLAGLYGGSPTGSDISVVTWGQICGTTDSFEQHQLSECHVLIFPEHLGTVAFQQGVDLAALTADYKALTGQNFPAIPPTPPGPTPVPPNPPTPVPVTDADRVLAAAIPQSWIARPALNWGQSRAVRDAVRVWLTSSGLTPGK